MFMGFSSKQYSLLCFIFETVVFVWPAFVITLGLHTWLFTDEKPWKTTQFFSLRTYWKESPPTNHPWWLTRGGACWVKCRNQYYMGKTFKGILAPSHHSFLTLCGRHIVWDEVRFRCFCSRVIVNVSFFFTFTSYLCFIISMLRQTDMKTLCYNLPSAVVLKYVSNS